MIDILVATHGSLSQAFEETSTLIIGESNSVDYIGFNHGDDVEFLEKEIQDKIQLSLKNNRQVLVFIDLLGGSPSNRCALVLNKLGKNADDVEFIAGVNLPMVLEAIMNREIVNNVQNLKKQVIEMGQRGIVDLKKVFNL